jgi:hypothetical protein
MSIPQRADKWIVLALMVGLGVFYVSGNTLPDGHSMVPWVATPITFGAVLTACYLGWCAICRRVARLLRVVPTSGHVRLFANGSFFVIMLALNFIPFEAKTVTIHFPAKDHARNSAAAPRMPEAAAEQAIAKGDPIAALVERLSASHLWQNGLSPILGLPATASIDEVIARMFEKVSFAEGRVTQYRILETRLVQIPENLSYASSAAPRIAERLPYTYIAALVRTDFGDKIVLLKYEDPRTGWWSRVYDPRPSG